MASQEFSYDFVNVKRDLTDVVNTIVRGSQTLLSLVPITGEAVSTKHEWLEDIIAPVGDTLNEDLDDSETGVDVVDGTKFSANQIIAFEGYDELMKVTGVSTNTLTVVRGYGSTTPEAISTGTDIKIISKPAAESSNPGSGSGWEPSVAYNYPQIFEDTAKASGTTQNTALYGIANELDRQVSIKTTQLTWDLNNALIYGRRVQRSASQNGTMGGLLQFVNAGGNVNANTGSAVDVTPEMINDLLETIYKAGGRPTAIVCNTFQARQISAFNASKLVIPQTSNVTGGYVAQFISDLPIGLVSTIIVDTSFPKNQLALVDLTKIAVIPYRNRAFSDFDATLPGADYVARRILGEYTCEIRNPSSAFGLIKNLKVS